MQKLIFAALVAAGLAGATLPAEAGGHEWWRSCGGHAYEGCDGIPRGPYARQYHHRHYPGCGHYYRGGGGFVQGHTWSRVRRETRTIYRGTLIVPRDGSPPTFIPAE